MNEGFVFIYAKGIEIKALNIEKSQILNLKLLNEGWVHTQTLNACVYIQYLHNDCEEDSLIEEIRSLVKRPS